MALAPVIVSAVTEQRFVFGAPRLTRLKTFDASTRATHWRRPLGVRLQTLEEKTSTNLNYAHSACSGNDAKGTGAAERTSGSAKIYEVEDVRCFATELELHPAVDGEVTEQRRIHVLVSWRIQGVGSYQPIEA